MIKTVLLAWSVVVAMYRRRWWEPLTVVLSVALACAGLTAVSLINQGAENELHTPAQRLLDFSYQITPAGESGIVSQADYSKLRRLGFTELVAFTRYDGPLITSEGTTETAITLLAVDALALAQLNGNESSLFSETATPVVTGSAVWAAPHTLPAYPEHVQVHIEGGPELVLLHTSELPQGVLVTTLHNFYRAPLSLVQFPLSGLAILNPPAPGRIAELKAALPAHLKLTAQSPTEQGNNLSESFSLNLWAMGMLMAVVSLFIVLNALHLMYRARLANLLRLRQMGISTSEIGIALLLEMITLTFVGSVLGVWLGTSFTLWLNPVIGNVFANVLDTRYFAINPVHWQIALQAWALSLSAVLLIMALPFWQLRRSLLIKHHSVKSGRRILGPLAATGLILSALLIATANSQTSALLAIAITLLSGCLVTAVVLPNLLGWLARLLPPRRALIHWSMSNARSLTGRTRLAISAFVVALAANSGMNVMVDSFRQATGDWLTQRLVAPYYLFAEDDEFTLGQTPEEVTLFPRLARPGTLNFNNDRSTPVDVRSYPDDPVFRGGLTFDSSIATPWQHFDGGEGLFINQQLSLRLGIEIGDTLTLSAADNIAKTYTVAGVYPDYGNPRNQVLLPYERMVSEPHIIDSVGVRLKSGYSETDFRRWLTSTHSDAQIYSNKEIIRLSMAEFDRTFVITDGLNLVTLLVAALSFLLSVTLLAMDIRPQLSLLRTFGVSTAAIRLAMMLQYLILCLGSALLALPFGIILAWLLVEKVNRYAFFWTYPLVINPLIILQSAAISIGLIILLLMLPLSKLHGKVNTRDTVNG